MHRTPLAALAAAASAAAPALADVRTYTIDLFPELPVSGTITSVSLDPRLAEPFLAGAQIVGARAHLDFTATDGFDAADLYFSLSVPLAHDNVLWTIEGGPDLGWAGAGPFSTVSSTTEINGTIRVGGRAVWFWDIAGDLDVDPPTYSGIFGPNSRVEIDYLPLPQALLTSGASVCDGQAVSMSVRISCAGPTAYEWQCRPDVDSGWTTLQNGANTVGGFPVNVSGATTGTLTADRGGATWSPVPGSSFEFQCLVTTTECGQLASNELAAPVSPPVSAFTELAFPGTMCAGEPAEINVFHDGLEPFRFAWRKDGVPIDPATNPSATTGTLLLGTLTEGSSGVYDCVVTDACGSDVSDPTTITVCAANFDCNDAADVADIFAFLSAWFAGEPRADFDASGGAPTVADIFSFLAAWFAGC